MLPGERGAVVVTGASTGLGAAIADELVRCGFTVFGTVRRTEDGRALEARGARAIIMDVTRPETIETAHRAVERALEGRGLAALVNNAGIPMAGPLELLPLADLRAVLEVNVIGVLAVTQTFLPLLKTAHGRIVNISSLAGRDALPFMGPYAASKHALEALSDSLRRELRPQGVSVTIIEPGSIQSHIWKKVEAMDTSAYAGSSYERPLARFRQGALRQARTAPAASIVATAVTQALLARRPPIRRVVSRHPWLNRLALRLPDRWVDWLIERYVFREGAERDKGREARNGKREA